MMLNPLTRIQRLIHDPRTWLDASGKKEFYMSCSSADIVGSGHPVSITPDGDPLLIANLQFNPSRSPAQDEFSAICQTDDSSSVLTLMASVASRLAQISIWIALPAISA
jgi:hypothetical protein